MKRLLLITLVTLLVSMLIVVGCSSPAPAPTTTAAPKTTAPTTAAPATTSAPTSVAPTTAAPATTASAAPIEIRFATTIPTTGGKWIRGIAPWSQAVEKATNGRVKVTGYPGGTLSTEKDTYDSVVNGVAHMGWFDAAMEPGRFPLTTGIFSMPGSGVTNSVMGSWAVWNTAKNNPEFLAEFKEVKVLFMHAFAPLVLSMKDKPVRTPADVKGLKIRAAPGGTQDLLSSVGATTVVMAPGDIYVSFEKGLLQGNAMGWEGIGAYRLTELATQYTPIGAFGGPQFVVVFNKAKWDSLPADIQQAILSVSDNYGSKLFGQGDDATSQVVIDEAKKRNASILTLTPAEEALWNDAAKPLQEKILGALEAKGLPAKKLWNAYLEQIKLYKP